MAQVRQELEVWNVELNENDCFPHFICTVCLLEFRKIFKFQHTCIETQDQLKQFYSMQQQNIKQMQIKAEICDDIEKNNEAIYKASNTDENISAFIYVDDLPDSEIGNESVNTNISQFKVPHIPLKKEIIEADQVPLDVFEKSSVELQESEPIPLKPEMTNTGEIKSEHFEAILNENSHVAIGVQCEHCLHISADSQEHRQHLLRIHETKPLECHICGKQFKAGTTQSRLKYHLKWHRINKHIKCPQCGFHCASRDILNEHKRAVHTKTACSICGKRLLPKKMRLHMEEHQLVESTEPHIECPYCLSAFATNIDRDQHILMAHTEESLEEGEAVTIYDQNCIQLEDTLQDNIIESDLETSSIGTHSASISFPPDNNLINEMTRYFMVDDSTDLQYENEDTYTTTLENEMSTVNITPPLHDQMQFACAKCPLSFQKVEQLIAHAEAHQQKALFCCHVCGKKFDLKFSLNRHIKRHKKTC